MTDMNRRDALRLMGVAPIASLGISWNDLSETHRRVRAARGADRIQGTYVPRFFTDHEYRTVRVLVDLIIPRDERSGSATDAGVPEFIDFIVDERAGLQTTVRGGLAWLDTECRERFRTAFVESDDAQRRAVLDDVAWPARARPEHSHGVAFFNRFRDLTATGFWSSRMGVEDLRYLGNRPVEWRGCPEEQLDRLGVRYE